MPRKIIGLNKKNKSSHEPPKSTFDEKVKEKVNNSTNKPSKRTPNSFILERREGVIKDFFHSQLKILYDKNPYMADEFSNDDIVNYILQYHTLDWVTSRLYDENPMKFFEIGYTTVADFKKNADTDSIEVQSIPNEKNSTELPVSPETPPKSQRDTIVKLREKILKLNANKGYPMTQSDIYSLSLNESYVAQDMLYHLNYLRKENNNAIIKK